MPPLLHHGSPVPPVEPEEDFVDSTTGVVIRLALVKGGRQSLAMLFSGTHPREVARVLATLLKKGAVKLESEEEGGGVELSLDQMQLA